jgi:hypothetical protein
MKKHSFELREVIPFRAENTPLTHVMKPGGFVQEILIVAEGTLNITGGAATGTALGVENPGSLLQRVELDAIAKAGSPYPDGKLVNLLTRSIKRREIFDESGVIAGSAITGAIAATAISEAYLIRFSLPERANPAETSLNTDAYASLQLTLTTGGNATMFSGNDRVWDWTGVKFYIYDRREAGSPGFGDTAVLFQSDVPVNITGANDQFSIDGELAKAESYYDVMLVTESTANRTLVDTVIKQVKVLSNNEQFKNLYKSAIKRFQQRFIKDKAQADTGLYLFKMAEDGLLGGCVRPINFVLDVLNPGGANLDRIIVNSRRIVLPSEYLPKKN